MLDVPDAGHFPHLERRELVLPAIAAHLVVSAEILALALGAARAAGELLLERVGAPVSGLTAKTSRTDLVSDADRDAEALLVGMIRAARPDDAIVAEEGGGGTGVVGRHAGSWIPSTGPSTTSGASPSGASAWPRAMPRARSWAWCTTPRAVRPSRPVVGTAPSSARRACAWARAAELSQSLIGTGFQYRAEERARQAERLLRVLPAVRDLRRFGSAALDLAWVACGRLDGYFESGLNPWDSAAGELLVREAGGVVEEAEPGSFVVAGPELFGPLRALVRDAAG